MTTTILMTKWVFVLSMALSALMSIAMVAFVSKKLIEFAHSKYSEMLNDMVDCLNNIVMREAEASKNKNSEESGIIKGKLIGVDISDPNNPKISEKEITLDKNHNVQDIVSEILKQRKESENAANKTDENIPTILKRVQEEMEGRDKKTKEQKEKIMQWPHGEVRNKKYFHWLIRRFDGKELLVKTKSTYAHDKTTDGMLNIWLNKRAVFITEEEFKEKSLEIKPIEVKSENDIISIKKWHLNR